MKAILHTKFGPAEELQLKEIEKPIPKDNEVLIKIYASTVTSTDCNVRNLSFVINIFRPIAKIILFGIFKPRINILGFEFAGVIEAVGKRVKNFKIGDRVFGSNGMKFSGHAEYISVPENGALVTMTEKMSFKEVAPLSLAANTALFFLKDFGNITSGQKVLIIGASGAIGSYAVQIAKYYDTEVTAVCSKENIELVKSIGADKIIDYTKEDFDKCGELFDIIFDVRHKPSLSICKKLLSQNGVYLPVNMGFKEIMQSIVNSKKIRYGSSTNKKENLNILKELFDKGKLKTIIDKEYSLEEIVKAFKYVEKGHKKGNVVIRVV